MKGTRADVAETFLMTALRLPRVLRGLDEAPRLTGTEASALAVLIHGGAMNIGDLARMESVRAPSMTRTVSQLETRGLVERKRDKADGRGYIVKATRAGKRLFKQGHERRIAPLEKWLDGLGKDDFEQLLAAMPLIEAMGELRVMETRASRPGRPVRQATSRHAPR